MNSNVNPTTDTIAPDSIRDIILDPAAYADGRIYGAYAWLRANKPIAQIVHPDFDPFWLITLQKDLRAVESDNDLFRAGDRPFQLLDRKAVQTMASAGQRNLAKVLPTMDPPDHMQYRNIAQTWFTPRSLKSREDAIRALAKKAVDELAAKGGRCDFVADLALRFPLRVIMSILGVPEVDEPLMLKLTQEVFGTQELDFSGLSEAPTGEALIKYMRENIDRFAKYLLAMGADRRAAPRDDLATVIATAKINDAPIAADAELGYYIAIATAGHDTTSSSLATAIWQLAENPDEFAKVKRDPSLIPGLVNEAIRWSSPVKHFMRSTSRATELGGVRLEAGEWLMLCYASASRDEAVIADADAFRVDRATNSHLAFGFGPHVCIGQHLAKQEMRLLLEELLPRVKSLSLTGPVKVSHNWSVNGPKTVPVHIEYED